MDLTLLPEKVQQRLFSMLELHDMLSLIYSGCVTCETIKAIFPSLGMDTGNLHRLEIYSKNKNTLKLSIKPHNVRYSFFYKNGSVSYQMTSNARYTIKKIDSSFKNITVPLICTVNKLKEVFHVKIIVFRCSRSGNMDLRHFGMIKGLGELEKIVLKLDSILPAELYYFLNEMPLPRLSVSVTFSGASEENIMYTGTIRTALFISRSKNTWFNLTLFFQSKIQHLVIASSKMGDIECNCILRTWQSGYLNDIGTVKLGVPAGFDEEVMLEETDPVDFEAAKTISGSIENRQFSRPHWGEFLGEESYHLTRPDGKVATVHVDTKTNPSEFTFFMVVWTDTFPIKFAI